MKLAPRRRRIATPPLLFATLALAIAVVRAPAQAATHPHDYTQADVDFMQGMIIHHAQAVVMSDWAESHGARPDLLILCKRIALSQHDEIALMQNWLLERGLKAPDPLHMLGHQTGPVVDRSPIGMPGMDMSDYPMMMSGMLSPAEMRQLDAARDTAFDRLYLIGMMKHHQGAIDMVAKLFATPGAGQQPDLSSFATDIDAGQRVEIARMRAMLNTLTPRHHE